MYLVGKGKILGKAQRTSQVVGAEIYLRHALIGDKDTVPILDGAVCTPAFIVSPERPMGRFEEGT